MIKFIMNNRKAIAYGVICVALYVVKKAFKEEIDGEKTIDISFDEVIDEVEGADDDAVNCVIDNLERRGLNGIWDSDREDACRKIVDVCKKHRGHGARGLEALEKISKRCVWESTKNHIGDLMVKLV